MRLPWPVDGVHGVDLDAEDLLDRDLDLRLVRVGVHDERVHVVLDQSVGLLGDDRSQDDVAGVSHGSHQADTSSSFLRVRRDVGIQRLDAEHQVVGVEHVVGVELIRRDHVHARQIAHALGADLVAAADDDQHLAAVGQRAEERLGVLGRRRLAADQLGDRVDPVVAGPVRQRAAQGGGDHLLRGPLAVVTRLGAVHDATAGELRCTRRTLTSAAGALLAVRLLAAAGDLTAGLGRVRALTLGRQLSGDHLVHQRDVGLDVEQLGGQLDVAVFLPSGVRTSIVFAAITSHLV